MTEPNFLSEQLQQFLGAILSASAVALSTWFFIKKFINLQGFEKRDITEYLRRVIEQHQYLDTKGTLHTAHQNQVPLDDIYVSLDAEPEAILSVVDRRLFVEETEALANNTQLAPEEKEEIIDDLFSKLAMYTERKVESFELLDLVNKNPSLIILGDPGAGKTTLLRYLAFHHATYKLEGIKDHPLFGKIRLPLYLRISEYAEHNKGESLYNFIINNSIRDYNSQSLKKLIQNALQNGECLILLDGMDEVVEAHQRSEIVNEANLFIRTCAGAGNHIVITSRVTGYRTAPLSGDILHFHIRDMTNHQIYQFLTRWCNAVEHSISPESPSHVNSQKAQVEIDQILHALNTNQSVRSLATNPLLLRTLAQIQKAGSKLPQRRVELYESATRILIKDWRLSQGIPQEVLIDEDEAISVLARLAAWLHQYKPSGIATEGEVRRQLSEYKAQLLGKSPDHPDIQSSVSNFIRQIREHTGLFIERAPKRYSFMHLAFEEYFAARWLISSQNEVQTRIRNKLHRPRWEEPVLLALSYYGIQYPNEQVKIIKEAILGENYGGPSPYEEILHRDLLFAVQFIADQDVNQDFCKNLIHSFFMLWLEYSDAKKPNYMKEKIIKIASMFMIGSFAQKELTDNLAQVINEKKFQLSSNCLEILNNPILDNRVTDLLLQTHLSEIRPYNHIAYSLLLKSKFTIDSIQFLLKELRGIEIKGLSEEKKVAYKRLLIQLFRGSIATDDVAEELLLLLNDKNPSIRILTIDTLSHSIQVPKIFNAVRSVFHSDKSSEVRKIAMLAIIDFESREGINKLFVSNQDEKLINQPEVFNAILASLSSEDEHVGKRIEAIVKLYDEEGLQKNAIKALFGALNNIDVNVQKGALMVIQNISLTPETITYILPLLSRKEERIYNAITTAVFKVMKNTKIIDILLQSLASTEKDLRAKAAEILRRGPKTDKVKVALIIAMSDKEPIVRINAINALADVVTDRIVLNKVLNALNDTDPDVRASAASALGGAINIPGVADALIAILQDDDPLVVKNSIKSLNNIQKRQGYLPLLLKLLSNDAIEVRIAAIDALSNNTEDQEVVRGLINCLYSSVPEIRIKASEALAKAVETPSVINALIDTVNDASIDLRISSIKALAKVSDKPELTPLLISFLSDPNFEVRSNTAMALTSSHMDAERVNDFLYALSDSSDFVRTSITNLLRDAIKSQNILETVINATKNDDPRIRANAIQILEHSTQISKIAFTLMDSVHDKDPKVRNQAIYSLRNVVEYPEVVYILLDLLEGTDKAAILISARTLVEISQNPAALLPDVLPSRLATLLSLPDSKFNLHSDLKTAKDNIIETLMATAPLPKANPNLIK